MGDGWWAMGACLLQANLLFLFLLFLFAEQVGTVLTPPATMLSPPVEFSSWIFKAWTSGNNFA